MGGNINELELFVAIVAAGSLTRAAIELGSSPPAVSRRLAALETRLGAKLIERSARRFELTEAGVALHERALPILAQLAEAEAEVTSHAQNLVGKLRIGAVLRHVRTRLAPELAYFAQLHPQLQIEFRMSERPLSLDEDELDIIFQIEVPSAANVVARKLTSSRFVICASPDYIKRRGMPQKPDDLLRHDCLGFLRGRHLINRWMVTEDDVAREITVQPRLVTNSSHVLYQWIHEGFGVGLQFVWDVEEDLRSGRLIECLGDYVDMPFNLYAIYAYKGYRSPKIERFLQFMDERMAAQPEL